MNKCYLDSNILIYIKNTDADQHNDVIAKIELLRTRGIQLFVSPLVIDEFIHSLGFLLQKRNGKRGLYAVLKKALKEILSLPSLSIVNPPADIKSQVKVVEYMEKFGLAPRDAYHLLIMVENKIDGFATYDNNFHKVFSAKIISKD